MLICGKVPVCGPLAQTNLQVLLFSFPRNFPAVFSVFLHDSDGRILSTLIEIDSCKLNLINLYAPNDISDRKTFFERLHDFFLSQGDLVISGDFNCVDQPSDKFHSSDVPSSDKKCLTTLLSDFSLVDVYRKHNPHGVSFMWSNSDHSKTSRLDRFLISLPLFKSVRSNKVLPCIVSDHDFVDLELLLDNRRNNAWKFSTNLLSDSNFITLISTLITEHKSKTALFPSLGDWWDNLIVLIHKASIDFSTRKKRLDNQNHSILTKQLIRAKNNFRSGIANDNLEINSLESALSYLISKEAEGAKIHSKAKWIEEGEKPTRFFFRLENKRAGRNSFDSLFDESGTEKFSHSDIELILTTFYKDLFTKNAIDMQIQTEIIDDLKLSLTDLERANCEIFLYSTLITSLPLRQLLNV